RITSSGESLGTPCYMAPEQVSGTNPVDARTDVYSTAVVLYEIVTGRPPFQGSNGFAVMLSHQNELPVAPVEIEPAIGRQLSQAIMTALEKSPERRFQSAADFHKALTEAMSFVPLSRPARIGRASHARTAGLVAGASMFLGGLVTWAAHIKLHKSNAPA